MRIQGGSLGDVQLSDGADLSQLSLAADARTFGDEAVEVVSVPHLFNGTDYDQAREAFGAGELLGAQLVAPSADAAVQDDQTSDDTDKTFTVPAATQWKLLALMVILVTNATAGNRIIELHVRDASDTQFLRLDHGVVQTASLTVRYIYVPGVSRESAISGGFLYIPSLPDLWLPTGFDIRAFESATISATDDMSIFALVDQRPG